MERHILVGDIGGTNPRFAMVLARDLHNFSLLHVGKIDNNNPDFAGQVNTFLAACGEKGWTTDTACFAIAGPITNNTCFVLNHAKFPVDGNKLSHQTALKQIILINDFEAIGHEIAIADLSDRKRFVPVPHPDGHVPRIDQNGNRAIIGPGTGLGVAYLPRQASGEFDVMASEGGNASPPLLDSYSMELALFVSRKLRTTRIDTEALVSGKGILRIAAFFLEKPRTLASYVASNPSLNVVRESIPAASVGAALKGHVPGTDRDAAAYIAANAERSVLCAATMHLFVRLLGGAAHDVALHGVATGGLVLAGGVAAKNKNAVLHGPFMNAFLEAMQPSSRDVAARTPVFISLDYDVSFFGCARKALLTFPQ